MLLLLMIIKIYYIYSKNIKRKKLYYFMKFYRNSQVLRYKKLYPNYYLSHNRTYSNLYSIYPKRKNNKENIKMSRFYNRSELYPFTPLINNSECITFRPNYFRSSTPYNTRCSFYKLNKPINQKYSTFSQPYSFKT